MTYDEHCRSQSKLTLIKDKIPDTVSDALVLVKTENGHEYISRVDWDDVHHYFIITLCDKKPDDLLVF